MMNGNRYLKPGAVVTAVLLIAASVVAWRSVAAQEGQNPTGGLWGPGDPGREAAPAPQAPVPGGPGFYMQSAAAFGPRFSNQDWGYAAGQMLFNTGEYAEEFLATLSLPNGATITQFVVNFRDFCDADLTAWLARCSADGGSCEGMAELTSSGRQDQYRHYVDTTIDHPVVDQQSYAYVGGLVLPGGCDTTLGLVGVRIDYAFASRLPLVTKE